jgi:hypothetical protein
MSDVPHSPGWWQAGDGRWYPPPPGLTDEMPSRAPTPAPDHPPYQFDPSSQGPLAPVPRPQRSPRRPLFLAILAIFVIGALLFGIGVSIVPDSSTTAKANDAEYQMAIEDLLDSELTNLIFIETFWESYGRFREEWIASPDTERPAVTERWLVEIDSEVAQFQLDLEQIQADYAARDYPDGSIPDSVRDLAMIHYNAWQRWADEILTVANEWLQDRTSTLSLYGYATEVRPELDTNIETTFNDLCATLRATQPTDGSYILTIDDICADS